MQPTSNSWRFPSLIATATKLTNKQQKHCNYCRNRTISNTCRTPEQVLGFVFCCLGVMRDKDDVGLIFSFQLRLFLCFCLFSIKVATVDCLSPTCPVTCMFHSYIHYLHAHINAIYKSFFMPASPCFKAA